LFYDYDQNGNRTRIIDSHNHTSLYSYNDAGRAISSTDPKGKITTMTYADNGVDLLETTDNLGRITRTYNNAHQVKSITDRMGYKTTYAYNAYGQITSTTQAKDVLDTTTIFTYDADHQLKQVTRDSKTLQSLTHDPIGRIKTDTDATGLALTYDYNNLNNITKVTYPDGKFAGYTYSDWSPRLLDSETSRSGRTTSYFFDALERLTQLVNPGSGSVRNVYDANGNLIRFEDPNGNMTSFAYDLDNRLVKKTYADGKYISFTYDGGGLLQSRTDARGVVTTYSYDENDQLLTTTYSDSTPAVAHEYDEHGRIIVTQDGTGRYEYSYDANSRLASVDGPWPEDSVGYQYDGLGRVATLDPQKGQSISYSYDTLGRLTGIQRGAGAYSYTHSNSNPLAQGLTRPNGSTTTYQRDFLSRLTEISNRKSSADIINQFGYTYNQVDLRSSESVTNVSQAVASQNELITYQYNKVNQLLSSRCPDKTFSYDNDGNMIRGYTPEGYEFDASYDAENRLTSIQYTDSGGVIHRTEYFYSGDHFLRRMVEYQNAVKTSDIRLVRQDFLDLQERDENNNVIREYLWGLNAGGGVGGLLALKQGGQEYSYVYDGKGNVSALLDTAQGVVAAYVYDPFGNLMSQSGSFGQPFRFSTKRYDEKTGLSYYGFRFYSPELGRWITRDPQGETGGLNLYAFALNNPISFVDPTGEEGGYFCDILQDKGSGDVGLECHDGKWWVGWMETQGIKCFTFQPENFTLCVRKKGDPNPPGSKGFVKRCTGRAWNGIMNAFGGRSRERDRRYFQDTSSFCAQQRADNDDDRPCNSGAGAPHG
jgi:RHS repeat-associated protein